MSEWKEFTAKTVDEALTNALVQLETTSDKVEYEIIEKESPGILGLFSKPAKIRVKVKLDIKDIAVAFLNKVFDAMDLVVDIKLDYNELENQMNVD
ncbi:MAG: Jag N-terminal domain-containing protein, partial [Lachnospiraceae bacterium]